MDSDIPADIRDFILKYVESVAYLEALMLLSRSPDDPWDSAALASRLFISVTEAESILNRFITQGLAIEIVLGVRNKQPYIFLHTVDRLQHHYYRHNRQKLDK